MRQSHEIALATQYQARAESAMEMYLTHMQVEPLSDFSISRISGSELSPAAQQRLWAQLNWGYTAFDNHHYQYTSGYLSEDAFQAQLRRFLVFHNNCEMRSAVGSWNTGGRESFVAFVESVEDSCPEN